MCIRDSRQTDRRTDGQTDGRTELLYQYRASAAVCWRAIIKRRPIPALMGWPADAPLHVSNLMTNKFIHSFIHYFICIRSRRSINRIQKQTEIHCRRDRRTELYAVTQLHKMSKMQKNNNKILIPIGTVVYIDVTRSTSRTCTHNTVTKSYF